MAQQARYEYTFVRFGEQWIQDGDIARDDYHHVIQEHAAMGWKLVQIFAPRLNASEQYYELIFERIVSPDNAE
ncbi:MAG: DUF4177 domain-containing protein [Bacteroidota bacterium]|nr:DUF4177 domain-containing protein [Candidatus Kapabacteria bacterium]MDW8219279.1 DUF4177 domain-containing protein [Bacteroidota bacterium]